MSSHQLSHDTISDQFTQWFAKYRYYLVLSVFLICALLIWQQKNQIMRQEASEQVAEYYYEYLRACQRDDDASSVHYMTLLKKQHPDHAYSALATLNQAADYIEETQYNLAQKELNWVKEHCNIEFLRDLANYKIAELGLVTSKTLSDSSEYLHELAHLKNTQFKDLALLLEAKTYANQHAYSEAQRAYTEIFKSENLKNDPAFRALIIDHFHDLMLHNHHTHEEGASL
ncbi:MAG: tetratricopeptide repeat protein [Gammaproteobacteria bacterium]|nr:tetratricopeptide repeat protein [Gammaproteobacteria bacterium]